MPQLLIPFILPLVAGNIIAATIVANVVFVAASLAASYAVSALTARSASKPKASQFQDTVRQAVAPRRRSYGTVLVSGPMAFYESRGSFVYILVLMNSGTIQGINEWWVSDRQVLINEVRTVVTAPFTGRIKLEWGLGFEDQVASPMLVAAFPEWTANHRLSGIAWTLMRLTKVEAEHFQAVYNSSTPSIRQTMEASLVYDPREADQSFADATNWSFSENPPLQLLDFMTNRKSGMGMATGLFDNSSFSVEADRCDERVSLKSGGSQPRYASSGTYELTSAPTDVIGNILDTCGGILYLTTNGKVGVEADHWYEPEDVIGDADIISWDVGSGVSRLQSYRSIRAKYTSPAHGYKEQAATPFTLPSVVPNTAIVQDFELPWVNDHAQALRLCKLRLYRDNPAYSGTLVLTCTGLRLLGRRRFRLRTSILNIDKVCEVKSLRIEADLKTVSVDFITLEEIAYDWDPQTEETDAPPIPPDTREVGSLTAPANLRARTGLRAASMWAGVSWNLQPSGQTAEVQYSHDGGDWVSLTPVAGQNFIEVGDLVDGDDYEVRVRFKDATSNLTAWTSIAFTTADDQDIPSDPTDLVAAAGQESVSASADQGSDFVGFVLEFFGAPETETVPSFSPVNATRAVAADAASGTITFTQAAGSRKIWARARSVANQYSNVIGPITLTVAAIPPYTGGGGGSGGNDGVEGGGGGENPTGGGNEAGHEGGHDGASGGGGGGGGDSGTGGLY